MPCVGHVIARRKEKCELGPRPVDLSAGNRHSADGRHRVNCKNKPCKGCHKGNMWPKPKMCTMNKNKQNPAGIRHPAAGQSYEARCYCKIPHGCVL